MRQRIVDLLATSRFANLPTVWSNILVAYLAAWAIGFYAPGQSDAPFNLAASFSFQTSPESLFSWTAGLREATPWLTLLFLIIPTSCLYLGGCFLNDWKDAPFDAQHKPARPIPSGRISKIAVFFLAFFLLTFGLVFSALLSFTAAFLAFGIILCIVAYTHWHKKTPASFVFMAASRALLYAFGIFALVPFPNFLEFLSFNFPETLQKSTDGSLSAVSLHLRDHYFSNHSWRALAMPYPLMIGLAAYIFGISLFARHESRKKLDGFRPSPALKLLFFVPLLTAPAVLSHQLNLGQIALALGPLVIALFLIFHLYAKENNIGNFVSRALANIPLVDATSGLLLIYHLLASEALATQQAGFLYLVFFLLSVLAYLLQKIAPAT